MAIPREHLEFTLWYLKQKKYVERNQGADFSLTAGGVDFVEEHPPRKTSSACSPAARPGPLLPSRRNPCNSFKKISGPRGNFA